jgi:hypothetical protein
MKRERVAAEVSVIGEFRHDAPKFRGRNQFQFGANLRHQPRIDSTSSAATVRLATSTVLGPRD